MAVHRIVIGSPLQRIAHMDAAAQDIDRQEQRPEQHVLIDVCTFVIAQTHRRMLAAAGGMRIGAALQIERGTFQQDHVAERHRPARPPWPGVEDQCQLLAGPARACAETAAHRTDHDAEHGVGQRPQRAQHLHCGPPARGGRQSA
ncbi:hypothetical protein XGA_2647 [Xanthomonas hortorum ATCC 19865]|nr:hypothetical protein XGA_2647 [Xanthomonas hortorum ATCC 19865]